MAISAVLGLIIIADQANQMSATYDEVTYLEVGSRWWRTGEQQIITRMGSPLTFWKIQQAPTLWLIDHIGDRSWIDEPITHQAKLLPWIRIGGSWIWLISFGLVAAWAKSLHGDRAMAMAALIFAMSPNLLAHGALSTMETPILAASAAMMFSFTRFLQTGRRRFLWGTAAVGGLAFSCKFTTVLIPPILGVIWGIDRWRARDQLASPSKQALKTLQVVGVGMIQFAAIMVLTNLVVTGFAVIPLSPRTGSHPILSGRLPAPLSQWVSEAMEASYPQDWVAFATQMSFQRNGGPSYLFGERRSTGWWYYYLVTLSVKVPLAFWLLGAVRVGFQSSTTTDLPKDRRGWIIPVYIGLFLLAAMLGSKRNYGIRYLLPLAAPAIVWVSALAVAGPKSRWAGRAGVLGMALALLLIHPNELSYFNSLAGGPIGGRKVLSDSNLDWGQGAKSIARLQRDRPEFRDLTWFYFGDTDPAHYDVVGRSYRFDAHRPPRDLPASLSASTTYLAVSASLQWGPWGPEGYFQDLNLLTPVRYSSDKTVAIYRTADLVGPVVLKTDHDRE